MRLPGSSVPDSAEGVESDIPLALWSRYQTYGVPHMLFTSWVAGFFLATGLAASRWGFKGALGSLLLSGLALVTLQYLTRKDARWDEALANDFGRRYQYYYDTE